MGLDMPPGASIEPLARVDPRPRTAGLEAGGPFRSNDRSAGVFCVRTLLIARSGLVAFLGPRSLTAGPVGAPRPTGDGGIGP